jgi:NADPH-dependent 2,4-dienoyl-CoA reductase/sulfur reductase-like enzyme
MKKLAEGREDDIRQCVGAGYCIDRIYAGGDALCIQNAATGREASMPHVIARAARRRRVVVVGAGPAGLEAARVCAERGHAVVLFEKDKIGGQINIAARATWREALSGIPRWLSAQVEKLGVDVRLGTEATADLIRAEQPDIVILATGGTPNPGHYPGAEFAVSTWDVLLGRVDPAGSVLVYDETGQHHASSAAEVLARRGCLVEVATHDRMAAEEVGTTNQPVHLREFYRHGVVVSPNLALTEIFKENNRLVAVLRNTMTGEAEERLADHIVVEFGTLPACGLFDSLKPHAINHGQTDLAALVAGRAQPWDGAGYALYRVGDALAGRNIHAAIYDSLRLCKEF